MQRPALLALEDGTLFRGRSVGAAGQAVGELVFNTGMTGYQEVLTDPSYCGQIVVMTYPEVGIYGVNPSDAESNRVQVAGYVVHRAVRAPFNRRATLSLTDYLQQAGIVAIEGIDTRALTRHLRTRGAMRGGIAVAESAEALDSAHLLAVVRAAPRMEGRNLASEVTMDRIVPGSDHRAPSSHIVLIDAGYKAGIVRDLRTLGASVTLVPCDADAETVRSLSPDGVLVSNGPGDPEPLTSTIRLIRELIVASIPVGGICLGHQLLGLAVGGQTYKMRFGHRGANHPVKELRKGQVLITTQNHGFAIDPTSLGIRWAPLDAAFEPVSEMLCPAHDLKPSKTMAELLPAHPLVGASPAGFGPVEVTHLSLNDGTIEGLRLHNYPAISVQFHPEASPGPHDAKGFFKAFMTLVRGHHA
ncbi:MAG: glutamine-hydrolyzing carbamoyl-phosphate synthase small subunit [Anaerolineae bacterium]